MNILNFIL